MHTHIHTYMHAYIHTYIHTYIHKYIHTYIRIYIVRACVRACVRVCVCVCVCEGRPINFVLPLLVTLTALGVRGVVPDSWGGWGPGAHELVAHLSTPKRCLFIYA